MTTHLPIHSSLDADATLATIALSRDAHATVLARHNLDFCCGGKRTLREACEGAGLNVGQVMAELAAEVAARTEATVEQRWDERPLDELIDFIVDTHHVYTHAALGRIALLAAKVVPKHGGRHPELAQAARAFQGLAADLAPHLAKEERVLFPYLRLLASPGGAPPPPFGTARNPVRLMMTDHDRAGQLLRDIASATSNHQPPEDGCASFRAFYAALAELHLDLMRHVSLENNVLFPRALRLEEDRERERERARAGAAQGATAGSA